jgi:hypothetical protein
MNAKNKDFSKTNPYDKKASSQDESLVPPDALAEKPVMKKKLSPEEVDHKRKNLTV